MNLFRSSPLSRGKLMLVGFTALVFSVGVIQISLDKLTSGKSGYYKIPTYNDNGVVRIVPQVPLNEALFTDTEVMDYVAEALNQALSLSFDNYKKSMTDAAVLYFTSSGWESFSDSFTNSELYADIFPNKEIIDFVPLRAPFMLYSGTTDGKINGVLVKDAYWVWRVRVEGRILKKSLKIANNEETEQEMLRNQRRVVADISFDLDLQRVPKGKGASAIKIINSSEWAVTWL